MLLNNWLVEDRSCVPFQAPPPQEMQFITASSSGSGIKVYGLSFVFVIDLIIQNLRGGGQGANFITTPALEQGSTFSGFIF